MNAVKAYYNGSAFVPVSPVNVKLNQQAIVTVLDEPIVDSVKPFEKFIGKLSDSDYIEITEALLETQRSDCNEWYTS